MKRYCLALDLVNDATLIAEYDAYHRQVWPDIIQSIHNAGIVEMEIYRFGNRLFMIMETVETFCFDEKVAADASNPKVQQWEQLMWQYQQAIPGARPGEKWVLLHRIFSLADQ